MTLISRSSSRSNCRSNNLGKRSLSGRSLRFEPLEDRQLLSVSVGGQVWNDANQNGVREAADLGIAGAVVEIHSSTDAVIGNADDVLLDTAVTSADGRYSFSGLPEGVSYYEIFRTPVGYTFTTPGVDSTADATGASSLFTVAPGQTDAARNAGLVGTASAAGWSVTLGDLHQAGLNLTEHVLTDAVGNVYVCGRANVTTDFDPGPGTYELTYSNTNWSAYVAKYSPTGALIWGRAVPNSATVALANDGSVYLRGSFSGTVDLDPGTGTFNVTGVGSGGNAFISKLDTTGNFVWAKGLGELSVCNSIVGDDGSVYTTGSFTRTVDFNPGPAEFNLTSSGGSDVFISKLDSAGNFVWAKSTGGTGDDWGNGLAIGPDGSVFAAGYFSGTADFDPSAAELNLTSVGGSDVFILKLNSGGNLDWAKSVGGTDDDSVCQITVAGDGSVYTTGFFSGTVDFNPGSGEFKLTGDGDPEVPRIADAFVFKLDTAGDFAWAKSKSGVRKNEYAMTVVDDECVYITGVCIGDSDARSMRDETYFISKMNSAGDVVWAKERVDSLSSGGGRFFATVAADGSVYTTGLVLSITKLDSSTGESVWTKAIAGRCAQAVTVGADGTVYVAGNYFGSTPSNVGFVSKRLLISGLGDILLSNHTVTDEAFVGRPVGDLSPVTTEPGATYTYTLVSGDGSDDNDSFSIVENQLRTAAVFDVIAKSSYTVRVRVMDQAGQSIEKAFTILRQGHWEPYTPNVAEIAVSMQAGTTAATVTLTFPDAGYYVNWYGVTRVGNSFSVNATVERWTGTSAQVVTPVSHSFDLGTLDDGSYTFDFLVAGTSVKKSSFAVTHVSSVVSISNVVVAEANRKNGLLEVNDKLAITWAVDGADTVTSRSLTVDGKPVAATYGPYRTTSGSYNLSGLLGTLSAGNHTYTIESTDSKGNTATAKGTFNVLPAATTISSVVVVEAAGSRDGTLRSNEPLFITWAVTDDLAWALDGSQPKATASFMIDGKAVGTIYGPYASHEANTTYWANAFGPLNAGSHDYAIQMSYADGSVMNYTGSFDVLPALPADIAISSVVVAEAKRTNGRLDANDPLVITWATSGEPVAIRSLTIDGAAVNTIYGPYGSSSSDTKYWAGMLGTIGAGTHSYTIQVADSRGNAKSYTGLFDVQAVDVTISDVVVAEAKRDNGKLDSTDPLVITWAIGGADRIGSRSISVDGTAATAVYGPYAGPNGFFYMAATFGPLSAGSHSYSIQSADRQGNAATYTGSFAVAAEMRAAVLTAVMDEMGPATRGEDDSTNDSIDGSMSLAMQQTRTQTQTNCQAIDDVFASLVV